MNKAKCRIQVYPFDREISMWHNSWFRRRSLPVARCFYRKLLYRHIEHCHSCLWTSKPCAETYPLYRITTPLFFPSPSPPLPFLHRYRPRTHDKAYSLLSFLNVFIRHGAIHHHTLRLKVISALDIVSIQVVNVKLFKL